MVSSSIRWRLAPLVVVAAAAVAGCHRQGMESGSQVAAPVPSDVATAPVAAPAAPAASTAQPAELVRQVHETRAGEPPLQSLQNLIGKYPHDESRFLDDGILAERLRALLGNRYDTLRTNLAVVGPLSQEGALWSIIGNRQHEGGSEAAAVVIDPSRNGLRVWLLHAGKQTVFTDVAGEDIPWPTDVKTTITNVLPATAR